MRGSTLGVAALLIGVIACQSTTGPTTVRDRMGQYLLKTCDGDVLPACDTTHADGIVWGVALADLTLEADGSYTWTEAWHYVRHDTTFITGDSMVSSGRYTVHGGKLSLDDTTSGGSISGSFKGDTLSVSFEAHRYGFVKRPPPSPEGDWAIKDCNDSAGTDLGCTRTDSTGAVVTEIGGALEVGKFQPDGRYSWGHAYEYHQADGDSTEVNVYEVGRYSWNVSDTTLTLLPDDTALYARGVAIVGYSNIIQIRRGALIYTAWRVLFPPSG